MPSCLWLRVHRDPLGSGGVKGTLLPSRSARFANDRVSFHPSTAARRTSFPQFALIYIATLWSWKVEVETKGYEALERVKDELESVKQLVRGAIIYTPRARH